jgi:hypothetical protein
VRRIRLVVGLVLLDIGILTTATAAVTAGWLLLT